MKEERIQPNVSRPDPMMVGAEASATAASGNEDPDSAAAVSCPSYTP